MANTLSALAPVLYSAAQEVSNEPFGVIRAINARFDDKGVAKGDKVSVPIAPTRSPVDFTPGATAPEGVDAVADKVEVEITASKKVSWHLTGEQLRSLDNGAEAGEWARQLVAQGMRALRNLAEADAAKAIKEGASRAVGTAGTTPFGSDLTTMIEARKVLADNGAPLSDMHLCIDTSAGLNLRKLGIIQQAYQAGSDAERRSGDLLRQFGFAIVESAGIATHTKGTATSVTGTGAVGSQSITIAGTSIATVPGDVITFAGDTNNKYVTGVSTSATGVVSKFLNRPGLRVAASAASITVGNNYVANLAFERNAVVGIMRPPLMPANPTMTMLPISDQSGMTYLLVQIAQYGQVSWELHLAWGFKVVQQEHVVVVMG